MGRWGRFLAWSDTHRLAVDAAGAVVVGLLLAPLSIGGGLVGRDGSRTVSSVDTVTVTLVMCVALAWRRVRPVLSAAVVYTTALAHLVVGVPLVMPSDLLVPWALWSVTVHGPRWAARVALSGAMVGSVVAGLLSGGQPTDRTAVAVMSALVFLTTWSAALARRARREALDALVDRARRLEIERDQQARLVAAAERARIAREMHDIVAHSLSVMIAQADGGRYAAGTDPQAAGRTLGTIAETGRAALTDMRRLLGVLRAEPTPAPPPPPAPPAGVRRRLATFAAALVADPRAHLNDAIPARAPDPPVTGAVDPPTGPLPAVNDIAALVEQVRAGGMRASLVRLGEPRHLPPGTGLTLYRVAQEALTNVLKHAGPDPEVTVVVQWLPDGVVLEVADDGRGAAADSDGLGQGLRGMRERVTMFGGQVSAGPRPGGGFRVRATVPTPRRTPTGAVPDAHEEDAT